MAKDKEVYPVDTFKIILGGAESGGLFNTVSGINTQIDPTHFDHVDANGQPALVNTPAKVDWGSLTCSRGMDKDMKLWQWHFDCIEKGITGQRKDIQIQLLDTKGQTVLTWSFIGAWPFSYSAAGQDAGGGGAATENVGFVYQRMERK